MKTNSQIGEQCNILRDKIRAQVAKGLPGACFSADLYALAALYWCRFDFGWDEAVESAINFVNAKE